MLEAELDEQAKLHRLAIDERDAEIEKLRAQLAAQILELKELMDSKLALDAEIATYRRLLQENCHFVFCCSIDRLTTTTTKTTALFQSLKQTTLILIRRDANSINILYLMFFFYIKF